MRAIISIFILFLGLSTTFAFADDCLDQNKIDFIRSKIQLQTSDIEQFSPCDKSTNSYKILQALILIQTIQFQSGSLQKPFDQEILPNDFWGYFSSRVNTIQDESLGFCDALKLAFVWGYANDGVVHICPALYDPVISLSERAETMLHEARHFEGYLHVDCISGPRKGMSGACDDNVEEHGSYAVTVEVLTKMALMEKDFSEVDRAMTKISALSYANEVFNKPIVPYEMYSVYLTTDDGQAYYFDASDKTLRPAPFVDSKNASIISRNSSLTIFPKDKSDAFNLNTFSASYQTFPAIGSAAIGYNAMSMDQRPNVVDIINADYISAYITDHHLSLLMHDGMVNIEQDIPWTIKQAFSSDELGMINRDSVYLLNEHGKMFRARIANGQVHLGEVPNFAYGLKSLALIGDAKIGLNSRGNIVTQKNWEWVPFEPLKGKKFVSMSRPFLWSSYFDEGTGT